MANTPREHPAYILFGVDWTPAKGSIVKGLQRQLDDAELQDALSTGRVQPTPRFVYTPLGYDGKQVGILTVPVEKDGPYTPVKDYEGLQAGAVYYRRGTQNQRATSAELKRIFAWFAGKYFASDEQQDDAWRQLFDAVHHFDPARTYILVADRIPPQAAESLYALGVPPWRAVIDFDPDSDISGLLSCIEGTLQNHRVIHRTVRGEYTVQPQPGTHWFFARGLSGRQETLVDNSHLAWLRTYKAELGRQLERIAGVINPSPAVALVLWSNNTLGKHLRTLIEELLGAFGDAVEIVIVSNDDLSFGVLDEEQGITFVKMGLRSLCGGLRVHFTDLNGPSEERYVLPTSSGSQIEIDRSDWLWLNQDIELLHRSVGVSGEDDAIEYRLGAEISWRNLHLRHDCDRDITAALRARVEADLKRRLTVRVNLYHEPGGGGTTVGHRLAWELHNTFPVGILKNYTPTETAARIRKLQALTESTVLIIIDGGQHAERDISDLYEILNAEKIPTVLVQILRRFQRQRQGKRQFWLNGRLSETEADRFRNVYSQAVPTKRLELAELARRHEHQQRNAFFFGLTAFGKNFRGLQGYVKGRTANLTDEQRRILVYLSMAHYYGQQSIPAQAFTSLLKISRSKTVALDAVFTDSARPALDLLVANQKGEWRTSHQLIAQEITQQVLSPVGSRIPEGVWRQNLTSWGKDFASFCRGDNQITSDRFLELVHRVFIYRDNVEVLGTERAGRNRFAQLIDDIPSSHGKREVLNHLIDLFPLEAHFHAHLGRFLSLNDENEKALECIDLAVSLQPNDHVLHHMKGMVLRHWMKAETRTEKSIDHCVAIAEKASESFEAARILRPDHEHGYISEVQTLIDLIDGVGRRKENLIRDLLTRPGTNPFLQGAVEKAEDLLDRVQHLHAGESLSDYAIRCRASLERIYGNYPGALQAWDSLLSRPEVAKPSVRRQIVWTLLRRSDGAWGRLTPKEINRMQRLLEDNLEEEVNDSTSLRLWLRVIRQVSSPPSLDSIIEKVSYWKVNTGALDAVYYLYVLHTLDALNGSIQGAKDAEQVLEECRRLAQFRRDRTRSFEWIGSGEGIGALIHQSLLGEWEDDFWGATESLVRIRGRIKEIGGPQRGLIEMRSGVEAFFVPGRSGFHSGRDENAPVDFHLGFSYDGPRAWNVQRTEVK